MLPDLFSQDFLRNQSLIKTYKEKSRLLREEYEQKQQKLIDDLLFEMSRIEIGQEFRRNGYLYQVTGRSFHLAGEPRTVEEMTAAEMFCIYCECVSEEDPILEYGKYKTFFPELQLLKYLEEQEDV